jgi:DNA replicative helicase MCM subunit Mcm2 (Cdc46/Mcm family)
MLCTLIRLSLAAARLQLRTSATSADAILAIRLVEESLQARSGPDDSQLLLGLHMMEMVEKTENGGMTFDKYVSMLDNNFNVAHAAEE